MKVEVAQELENMFYIFSEPFPKKGWGEGKCESTDVANIFNLAASSRGDAAAENRASNWSALFGNPGGNTTPPNPNPNVPTIHPPSSFSNQAEQSHPLLQRTNVCILHQKENLSIETSETEQ